MGHSDISTTMNIYADCTAEQKQEVLNNLDGRVIIKWIDMSLMRNYLSIFEQR